VGILLDAGAPLAGRGGGRHLYFHVLLLTPPAQRQVVAILLQLTAVVGLQTIAVAGGKGWGWAETVPGGEGVRPVRVGPHHAGPALKLSFVCTVVNNALLETTSINRDQGSGSAVIYGSGSRSRSFLLFKILISSWNILSSIHSKQVENGDQKTAAENKLNK
jgi:hypothetical protein